MAVTIPFTQDTYSPKCITGNAESPTPVEFDLSAVGGPGRARLKSILLATEGLEMTSAWSPETQESVIAAFRTGAPVFADGIDEIRNLYAPAVLAKRLGLIPTLPTAKPGEPLPDVPITSGRQFAAVCGYFPVLSFEIAMQIANLCKQGDIDPRFFDWLSTSLGVTPERPRGTVGSAHRARKRNGTAASPTPKAKRGAHT